MEYRTLELNIISAKDLKNVNFFSKMDVYVVVSISGDHYKKQKTSVDREGGINPTWNFPMKFTIDNTAAGQNRLTLVFTLRSDRSLGDKDIGEVIVPVKELLESSKDGDSLKFMSYQVRKPSGKPKGTLNLSYKLGPKVDGAAPVMAQSKGDEPVTAYPPAVGSSTGYPTQHAGASVYPPPGAAYPPAGYGYPSPQPQAGYGYPSPQPQAGYGYPPPHPQPSYGYQPPPPGYYPPQQPKKNKFGPGLGVGLLGGALGGLIIGDMLSDAAYDGDFDGGFDCDF